MVLIFLQHLLFSKTIANQTNNIESKIENLLLVTNYSFDVLF